MKVIILTTKHFSVTASNINRVNQVSKINLVNIDLLLLTLVIKLPFKLNQITRSEQLPF